MNIIFMGSPDFAVPGLRKINNEPELNIKAVITQTDKLRGRGQKLKSTPVKFQALKMQLDVIEEKNINRESFLKKLRKISPDCIVVVAFGQKLGQEILSLPKYGCINLHASLLPEYRGASPIHQVIIDGKKTTGVTTMYMNEGWDTGDIIYQKKVKINRGDTAGILHNKLAIIGADLLIKTMIDIKRGVAPRKEQNDELASYAKKIDKNTGNINWNKKSIEIYNLIRGLNPWPGAFTYYQNELLKIWSAEPVKEDMITEIEHIEDQPGRIILSNEGNELIIKTADGFLKITEIQLAGRQKLSVKDFLRGYTIISGEKLGQY